MFLGTDLKNTRINKKRKRGIIISRLSRENLKSSFFHVMIQGHKKENIFGKTRYIHQYINLIKKFIKETDIKIIAYCIMSNHVHFLLQVDKIEQLSKLMQRTNTAYACYYNYMEKGRVGHVYRDRYKSQPINSHKYLIQCIKYIHFNPVKAHMVNKCSEYKFSSYNYFCKKLKEEKFHKFLTKEDYENICQNVNYDIEFLDVEKDIKEVITNGIAMFLKENEYSLFEVFTKREVFRDLIFTLKQEKMVKYIEMMNFFEITRGSIQKLIKS